MSQSTQILLALFVPLVGGVLLTIAGRWPNIRETITLTTAGVLMLLVWSFLPALLAGERPEAHLATLMPGLSIAFKIEPLGMLFACLASLLWIVNSVYSIGYMRGNHEKHQTRFYACFTIALSAAIGIAFAENLFTLFVFYEVLTLSTYPLVAHKGDPQTIQQARVYMGILLATSIGLLLPAIIFTYSVAGTLSFTPGGILEGHLAGPAVGLLLLMFVLGVGKAAVMPVHRWLPAAMVAPTPVSALLHAVAVVKAGVFTVTKVILYIFGPNYVFSQAGTDWLIPAACFTIVAASVVALRQTNLKRMLAYSTVAQLSYVVMAAALLAPISQVGAALHIFAHGVGKITLFFAAGAIYVASKKTELGQLNGIGRRMPITMVAFTIGALSMIGIPPTAGAISKWGILGGALDTHNMLVILTLLASTLLNCAYFLPVIFRAFLMPEDVAPKKDHREAPWPMVLALSTTALFTLAFFFFNGIPIALEMQIYQGAP
ncbi:MAG: monovalent cation/H+ antiporter subunit D family protein [Burkholderiaceae bacterium]